MENNNPQDVQDDSVVISLDDVLGGGNQYETSPSPETPQGTPPDNPQGTPPAEPNEPTEPQGYDDDDSGNDDDEVLSILTKEDSFLTATDLNFKKSMLETFGGTKVDSKGNLLNAKNQIVLSYQDLNKYVDTGEMNLDADGNLINALGEIVKNADAIVQENPLESTVKEIADEYGFNFVDESNNPKVYSDDKEGRRAFAEDIIANTSQVAVSSFLDSQPELKDVFYYLQNGGDLKDYSSKEVDYTAIDINNLSKEEKLSFVRQSLERQNIKNGASMLKLIENAGDDQIAQSTAEALLTLSELTSEEREDNERAYQAKLEEDNKKVEEYWDKVEGVIKQGKLRDLNIAESDRADFFKYIASPINGKGETQERIDASKEDIEFNLMVSYLRYKKYDISKLVNDRAGTSRLDKFKNKFTNPNPKIESSNRRVKEENQKTGGSYTPNIEDLLS